MKRKSNLKDLTNTNIKGFLVEQLAEKTEHPATLATTGALWWCRCRCGRRILKRAGDLQRVIKQGRSISCGCLRRTFIAQNSKKSQHDYPSKRLNPGTRFGNLVTTGVFIPKKGWVCRCDCGKEVIVIRNRLVSANTKSCGCLRGKHFSQQKGTKHPRFNKLLTPELREKRKTTRTVNDPRWGLLARKTKQRDKYTCAACGQKTGGHLESHHVSPWTDYPELRYEESNIVTLCKSCHMAFHRCYGFKGATKAAFTAFLNQKNSRTAANTHNE